MTDLIPFISKYGWQAVLLGVLLYIVLRGRITFRYPR